MIINSNAINFEQYLEDLSFEEAPSLKAANEFAEEVAEFADTGDQMIGPALPWTKTHGFTRLGEGKLSIWAGANGSGKSLLLGQVITSFVTKGDQKAAIASLEMQPKQTLYRMICQSATCKASRDYSLRWLNKLTSQLWIYDQLDTVSVNRILGMAHYAAHELKVDHLVIDSLTKCGVGRDYEKQAAFVDRLQWCAKTWGIHIHLVCHMRKSDTSAHKEGKNDIRGAAEITDLADNVFILRRNKVKEKAVELMNMGKEFDQDKIDHPCAILAIEKNRDYGHETEFGLWHDRVSGHFRSSDGDRLMPLDVLR